MQAPPDHNVFTFGWYDGVRTCRPLADPEREGEQLIIRAKVRPCLAGSCSELRVGGFQACIPTGWTEFISLPFG